MHTKSLLTATAAIELPTGLVLMAAPSFAAQLLLGEALDSRAAFVVGRVAGAALLAIGVSCCAERESERTAGHCGLPIGLVIYNAAVAALFAQAALVQHLRGPLLWPAVAVHGLLALWCGASVLRQGSTMSA